MSDPDGPRLAALAADGDLALPQSEVAEPGVAEVVADPGQLASPDTGRLEYRDDRGVAALGAASAPGRFSPGSRVLRWRTLAPARAVSWAAAACRNGTFLITSKDKRGQPPTASIREQPDDPRRREIISDKYLPVLSTGAIVCFPDLYPGKERHDASSTACFPFRRKPGPGRRASRARAANDRALPPDGREGFGVKVRIR